MCLVRTRTPSANDFNTAEAELTPWMRKQSALLVKFALIKLCGRRLHNSHCWLIEKAVPCRVHRPFGSIQRSTTSIRTFESPRQPHGFPTLQPAISIIEHCFQSNPHLIIALLLYRPSLLNQHRKYNSRKNDKLWKIVPHIKIKFIRWKTFHI